MLGNGRHGDGDSDKCAATAKPGHANDNFGAFGANDHDGSGDNGNGVVGSVGAHGRDGDDKEGATIVQADYTPTTILEA